MRRTIDRLARVAFMFAMMNYAALAGLLAALRGRDVWQ